MLQLLDGWFKMNVGEGAFYALFGLVFVIVGIALLILILMLVGRIMRSVNEKRETPAPVVSPLPSYEKGEEDETPELVAAVTAALMAYYERENVKCDFVVRRIKRI